MSKYTMTIKEYCESKLLARDYRYITNVTDFLEHLSKEDIMEVGRTIFPEVFPFYTDSEDVKQQFEDQFIQHFYFYEIGQETIGQFKWYLEDFLNTRMPYYADLFATKLSSLTEAIENYDITKNETEAFNESENRNQTLSGNTSTQSSSSSQDSSTSTGVSKDKQFPLNDSTIQEIGRTENDNSDSGTSSTTGSDTSTTSETVANTKQDVSNTTRNSREHGFINANKVARTKEFRELIFSINELIFEDAKKNHLFFELW